MLLRLSPSALLVLLLLLRTQRRHRGGQVGKAPGCRWHTALSARRGMDTVHC